MTAAISVTTLGCRANQADSDYILTQFVKTGFRAVRDPCRADVCVVNTCTVTSRADHESREVIRRIRRENPSAKVIVTGCYANLNPDQVRRMPEVDAVWETKTAAFSEDRRRLSQYILEVAASTIEEREEQAWIDEDLAPLTPHRSRVRALVRVQNGCNLACSYCIVPQARGRSRSLPIPAVIDELRQLHDAGYHEAVLTGIHLGHYGLDLTPRTALIELICHIIKEKPIARVRLSSIDPNEIHAELIDLIAENPMICRHFHIPYQSGSPDILKAMRRGYKVKAFDDISEQIHAAIPGAAIGTDIIVGFPGESDGDFAMTMNAVERLPIHYVHVFPYSDRNGTRAAAIHNKVPEGVKKERARRLQKLVKSKRAAFYQARIGEIHTITAERRRDPKTGLLKGITDNYVPVHFRGEDDPQRKVVTLRIVEAASNYTVGAPA